MAARGVEGEYSQMLSSFEEVELVIVVL